MTRRHVVRRLLTLLKPFTGTVTAALIFRVLNQALGVALAAFGVALAVSAASGSVDAGSLGLLAATAVVKGVFRYLEQFAGHAVAFRLLASLRVEAYQSIARMPPLEDDRSGDLMSRVIGDVDRVEPFFAHTIAPFAGSVLVPLVVSAGLAVWVDLATAVVSLVFPLLMVVVVPWIARGRVGRHARRGRELAGEAAAALTDAVQGAREVMVFSAEPVIVKSLEERAGRLDAVRNALGSIAASRRGLGELLSGVFVLVMMVVAAEGVTSGAFGLAQGTAAVTAAWVGSAPARALEDVVPDLEQALAAGERLFDLDERIAPRETMGSRRFVDGSISLAQVEVRRADTTVLENITFDVPSGSFVALVGPTGSGKSTIADALAGFRHPVRGRVAVGGVDVSEVAPGKLRRHLTLVPQRVDLFSGSVADNLRLGDPEADEDRLWDALRRTSLDEVVRGAPGGLDADVGEWGGRLSGGERQRVALARGLLMDAPILVLDEATSELDEETERRVLHEVVAARGETTILVITHRLSAMIDADVVVVLERGRIVETGSHRELLSRDGRYAAMWRRDQDIVNRT